MIKAKKFKANLRMWLTARLLLERFTVDLQGDSKYLNSGQHLSIGGNVAEIRIVRHIRPVTNGQFSIHVDLNSRSQGH